MNGSALESRMLTIGKGSNGRRGGLIKPRWFDRLVGVTVLQVENAPKPQIEFDQRLLNEEAKNNLDMSFVDRSLVGKVIPKTRISGRAKAQQKKIARSADWYWEFEPGTSWKQWQIDNAQKMRYVVSSPKGQLYLESNLDGEEKAERYKLNFGHHAKPDDYNVYIKRSAASTDKKRSRSSRCWKNSSVNKTAHHHWARHKATTDNQSAREFASAIYIERLRQIDADEQSYAQMQIETERKAFRIELDQERDIVVKAWLDALKAFPLLEKKYAFGEWNHETAPVPNEEDDFLYGTPREVVRTKATMRLLSNELVLPVAQQQYAY